MSNESDRTVDDIYYKHAGQLGIVRKLSAYARDHIYRDFIRSMAPRPGDTILDVGVSDVVTDEANLLERNYPHRGDITCAGIGDGKQFREAFPGVGYVQISPKEKLPFPDKNFAIATCNAVLEHVGGPADQRFLLAEMSRVAERIFVSVPNRWFPVEHHTALPLLHYHPGLFRFVCAKTHLKHWARPDNLWFLSAASVREVWPAEQPLSIRFSGLRMGPFSSNIAFSNIEAVA